MSTRDDLPAGLDPAMQVRWKIYAAESAERLGDWILAANLYTEAAEIQEELANSQVSRVLRERVLGSSNDLKSRHAYAYAQAGDLWKALNVIEGGRGRSLTQGMLTNALTSGWAGPSGPPTPDSALNTLKAAQSLNRVRNSGRSDSPEGAGIESDRLVRMSEEILQEFIAKSGLTWLNGDFSAETLRQIAPQSDVLWLFHSAIGGGALAYFSESRHIEYIQLPAASTERILEQATRYTEAVDLLATDFIAAVGVIDSVCKWLGDNVLRPIMSRAPEIACRRVRIIPATWFSVLPVHSAWQRPEHPEYGERRLYPLLNANASYLPGLRPAGLLSLLRVPHIASAVIVVGEPPSDKPQLPSSIEETSAVVGAWPNSRRLWRKGEIMAALGEATLIHFASHAKWIPGMPLRSGLNTAADEWVEVRELMPIPLRGYPLCILSGCRTADVGHTAPDEATGLVGGLLVAGARGVVASHWPVDDFATRCLMKLFHTALASGRNVEVALAVAQKGLRDASPTRLSEIVSASEMPAIDFSLEYPFRHPYYWAGFSYTGF